MEALLDLTFERKNVTAPREALALIFVICEYIADGFETVNEAALRAAEKHVMRPYEHLISLLASGDLDVQINSLTLINVLLSKAPDKTTRRHLVHSVRVATI